METDTTEPLNSYSEGLNYYQNDATENALKIRLAVEPVHERIEMYLSGHEYIIDQEGKYTKALVGESKANPMGVRAIMNVVMSYINAQTVQGNLTPEELGMVMMDFRKNMGSLLAWRSGMYGIKRSERQQIIDFLEPLVFMFITRTKSNKERESYGMRTIERGTDRVVSQKRGWFK